MQRERVPLPELHQADTALAGDLRDLNLSDDLHNV
jgi:hypothetical protein